METIPVTREGIRLGQKEEWILLPLYQGPMRDSGVDIAL